MGGGRSWPSSAGSSSGSRSRGRSVGSRARGAPSAPTPEPRARGYPRRMRIAFLGNDPWSVPPLEALARDRDSEVALVAHEPAAARRTRVAPHPDRGGRGRHRPGPAARGGRGRTAGDGLEALAAARPEVLVVVAYGELLTLPALALAPGGAINLHFSLLPRWRGASPVHHAILAGDRDHGVSVMQMDEGLDTGPRARTARGADPRRRRRGLARRATRRRSAACSSWIRSG